MKTMTQLYRRALLVILSTLVWINISAQCTMPLAGPFPLPQFNQYNCGTGICNNPQFLFVPWQPGDSWSLQVPNMLPFTDYYVNFGLDPLALAVASQLEITVYDQATNDIIAHAQGISNVSLDLFFQFTGPGAYILTISDVLNCGLPSLLGPFFDFEIDAFCPLFCPLDRIAATNQLLSDPDFLFDPAGLLMCPFDDFGFGAGFEGLLPPGTEYASALDLIIETPPPPKFMDQPGYLFFYDPLPGQMFQHDVDFFYVNALFPAPTIANGGILPCPADWWPYILPPGTTTPIELFNSADFYYSDFPLGPLNPDGLSGGSAAPTAFNAEYTDCPALVDKPNNKCALVFSGFNENRAKNSVKRNKERINMRDCYDKDNIVTIENGTQQQFCDSLDAILNKDPKCEELCIYIIAHGIERADGSTLGGFGTNGGMITPNEWQAKMDSIAKKGIVTHITFETCRATAIGNPFNWKLPEGSTVTFASGNDESAWAYTYKTPSCDTINEGIFSHAIEECRKDVANADLDDDGKVSYKEGVKWVLKSKPCYSTVKPAGGRRYPAGPPPDSAGYDPKPSFVCIGATASSISKRYKMPAGFNADKVCIVLSGNRVNGTGLVYTSTGNIFVPHTQTKTYNADRDETEVCFENATKFTACVRYWFHYYDNSGERIRVKSATAKTCPPFTDPNNRSSAIPGQSEPLPTTEVLASLSLDGSALQVSVFNRGAIGGGLGVPVTIDVGYRISDDSIDYAEQNLGFPAYADLTYIEVDTGIMLDTNTAYQFEVPIPQSILPGQILLVEVDHNWPLNATEALSIHQFEAVGTASCLTDVTYVAGSVIPDLTNSETFINLDDVTLANDTSAFNAETEINLLPGTEIPLGKQTIFYILGCDPN